MYVNNLRVTRYTAEPIKAYYVDINSYHVEIRDEDGKVVFKRGGEDLGGEWYDEKHQAITKALEALEHAILAAVR